MLCVIFVNIINNQTNLLAEKLADRTKLSKKKVINFLDLKIQHTNQAKFTDSHL